LIASVAVAGALLVGGWWLWPAPTPDETANTAESSAQSTAEADIDGDWIAELQKPGQPTFRVRLTLSRAGSQVIGTVRYPTGDASILDGRFADGQLTFHTEHVPQFASAPATIRLQGRLEGDTFRLTVADEGGVATGTARRATSSSPQ
jgi:hypothetical protein